MNNGQVMLMDDFLSEEEQMLMAQGYYMDENDDGRYYFDQDGNLSNIFRRGIQAIDKGLAKFDQVVIQPAIKVVPKVAGTVANLAMNKEVQAMAMGIVGGKTPTPEQLKSVMASVTGKNPGPGDTVGSMIGNSPELLEFLQKRTAINVPANSPELIPEARELANGMDMLKNYMASMSNVRGPATLPPFSQGPLPQQTTGMDIGSLIKNPVVLGVGGLVLLKVLKVF